MSLEKHTATADVGGKTLTIETGHIARQADGSVMARYGDTVVFVAAVQGRDRVNSDFLALTVDYREKTYAAGKFPGGFIKREGRPTTKEILTCRLIDRPVRPLFPAGYTHEIAVNALVLSADGENDPDILSVNAASAALALSGMPIKDFVAGVRVGFINDEYVVNPTTPQLEEESTLDLTVVGTKHGVTMVECGSAELSEEVIQAGIEFGFKALQPILDAIGSLKEKHGKPCTWKAPEQDPKLAGLLKKVSSSYREKALKAHHTTTKMERQVNLNEVYKAVTDEFFDADAEAPEFSMTDLDWAYGEVLSDVIRSEALEGRRSDGRGTTDVRPISCEVGVLPRTHGSAIFTRGETQALVTVTLGSGRDAQIVDGLGPEYEMDFYLQYNFPSYCVGEAWPNRGPKRREFGHGALADRSLRTLVPAKEDFPYTLRVVSEIMESNGSSSMATVCGGSLAMMDAGVPMEKPVAGIAMGLISEGDKHAVLSDILGSEDHDGDMDFKVAGTRDGITALQMDIKIENLSFDIMKTALTQAKAGRLHILEQMTSVIAEPRKELSNYAPRMIFIRVNPEKIGMIIGPGGKMVRAIQERTQTTIEIEDDGTITVSGAIPHLVDSAKEEIEGLTAEAVVGQTYDSRVTGVVEFGCFCEILPGQEGLLHISEYSYEYLPDISAVVKVGDIVKVKVLDIEGNGRIRLSRRALMEKPADYDESKDKERQQRSSSGSGGGRPRRDRAKSGGGGRR